MRTLVWVLVMVGAVGPGHVRAGQPSNTLWAADGAGGTSSNLYQISEQDGTTIDVVGPIGFAVTGLAVDPTTGTMYGATSTKSANSPSSLITIDRTSGAGTLVAAFSPKHRVADITVDVNGQLFGFASFDEDGGTLARLFRIDKATGALTAVGGEVTANPVGGGIAFCNDLLYLGVDGSSGVMRVADPVTGDTTVVGNIDDAPLDNRAFAALACSPDGRLVAANHSSTDESHLFSFDRFDFMGNSDRGSTLAQLDALAYDGVWDGGLRAVPSAAVVGQTVTFTGVRGSGPTEVMWDFGDGATGSGATTTHVYDAAGTYEVTYTATSSGPTHIDGSRIVTVVEPAPSGRRQILWGVDGSGANCTSGNSLKCGANAWLYRIDIANGAATPVGPTGYALSAIAVDPIDGTLFGVSGMQSPFGLTPSLVRLDKATGAATIIAPLTPFGPPDFDYNAFPDLAFDASGQLFGWGENSDDLYRIDKATGEVEVVGVSGFSTAGSGITFDEGGVLFLAQNRVAGPLSTVDVATGVGTTGPIFNDPPAMDLDEIPALSTAADGTIYGVVQEDQVGKLQGAFLFTVDTATATMSGIGRTLSYLDAMEFEPLVSPMTDGAPTITPQPALPGETLTFTSNASGFGGLPITHTWEFGDGMVGGGNPVTHEYAQPGTFSGKLTIDDGQSDPVEQPFDVVVASDLGAKRTLIRLNFAKASKDVIKLKGTFPVPEGFTSADQAMAIDVGGAVSDRLLNAKGRAAGVAVKSNGKFKVVLTKGAFAAALEDEGLTNEAADGKAVAVRMLLEVGPHAFGSQRALTYDAKAGKSGKAK